VGPRAGLDAVSNRKIPTPCWKSNPDHPIVQPVASRLYRLSYPGKGMGPDFLIGTLNGETLDAELLNLKANQNGS
jgi:hypothetical protein